MTKALKRRTKVERVEEIEAEQDQLAIGQWYWLKVSKTKHIMQSECTPAQWKDAAKRKYEKEEDDDEEVKVEPEEEEPEDEEEDEPEEDEDEGEEDEESSRPPDPERRHVLFEYEEFVCITHLGSNYALMTNRYGKEWRVHFDDLAKETRRELDPQRIMDEGKAASQKRMNMLMGEVKEITRRLGVSTRQALAPATEGALARMSDAADPSRYKAELVLAKEKLLPDLFREIEDEGKELARWMTAPTIPLKAEAAVGRGAIEEIEERIFSVELYAGLIEEVTRVRDGKPAEYADKIHILQSLHFMDEECLVNYEAGGMDFDDLADFEKWMAKPENFNRLFPFPRTLVAFRVRRHSKEYEFSSWRSFIQFDHGEWVDANKLTFLYVRNGEQLFRLATKVEFGARMFPDSSEQMLATKKLWVSGRSFISDDDYQELKERQDREYKEAYAEYRLKKRRLPAEKRAYKKAHAKWLKQDQEWELALRAADEAAHFYYRARQKWIKENPAPKKPQKPYLSPWFSGPSRSYQEYRLLDPQDVQYDDMMARVTVAVKQYNKIALVLQGLLDRSPVLHPHPGWKIFLPEAFEAGVKLVYDADRAITAGDAPDFEAYRAQLNKSLHVGSYTVGQQKAWMSIEAEKYNERYQDSDRFTRTYYQPSGNPGPGLISKVAGMAKGNTACRFVWKRERLREKRDRWGYTVEDDGKGIPCSVVIPMNELLNVSAYIPGDFKQFFDDPRTRQDYLEWAPLMLAAEDWYAERRGIVKRKKSKKKSRSGVK
jgi:hypothetical protein